MFQRLLFVCMLVVIGACSPKVGSDRWCSEMEDKAKGDWTANEAADYAKHCIVKIEVK